MDRPDEEHPDFLDLELGAADVPKGDDTADTADLQFEPLEGETPESAGEGVVPEASADASAPSPEPAGDATVEDLDSLLNATGLGTAETTTEASEPSAEAGEAPAEDLDAFLKKTGLGAEAEAAETDRAEQAKEEEEEEKEAKPSILARIAEASPYTVMLGASLVALAIAVLCLVLELWTYDFDIRAKTAPRGFLTPAAQPAARSTTAAAWPAQVKLSDKADRWTA